MPVTHDYDNSPRAWLKRVLETQEDEITCTQCANLVSGYVQIELQTGNAAGQVPRLAQHLNQCPACWETYQTLLEVARMEAGPGLPGFETLSEWLKRGI